MGKVAFTPSQELVFKELAKHEILKSQFYLTGGTALSVFYLQHRYSQGLDFFSKQKIPNETIAKFMNEISLLLNLKHRFTLIEETRVFEFEKRGKLLLKVDFGHWPYPLLKKGKIHQGISVDSLLDIATNKMMAISQRSDIKDFVDLYFLLKKFSFWDLLYAVENKFKRKLDLMLLSADFLKAEGFDFLPKMAVALDLKDLQRFFRQQSKKAAGRAVSK